MKITAIIPTAWRKPELTRSLVHAIAQEVHDVILVDNSQGAYDNSMFDCLSITDPRPFNWSRVNNYGVRYAGDKTDFFLFLNDDLEVIDLQWLGKLMVAFDDPNVGVASACVELPDGCVPGPAAKLDPAAHSGVVGTGTIPDGITDVQAIGGACFAVRKDVFHKVGGFDERFEITHSDTVFGLQAAKYGRVVLVPDSRIRHYERSSRGPDIAADTKLFRSIYFREPVA